MGVQGSESGARRFAYANDCFSPCPRNTEHTTGFRRSAVCAVRDICKRGADMEHLFDVLKGFAVGASMTVPGVSGGTMAMILGVYDRLITAVSRIFSEPKKHILFLLKFCAGGAAGVVLLAGVITWALSTPAGLPLRFAFMGAVAGGIPLIFRKAGLKKISIKSIPPILTGAVIVVLLAQLPEGLFSPAREGAAAIAVRFAGGVIVAAALVLPGISASHMMYMLGIYEPVMDSVSRFDILSLLPLAAGLLVGTFLTARLLEKLLERHSQGCYLVILGFMAGSLRELIPAGADGVQLMLGAACALIGFAIVKTICDKERIRAAAN